MSSIWPIRPAQPATPTRIAPLAGRFGRNPVGRLDGAVGAATAGLAGGVLARGTLAGGTLAAVDFAGAGLGAGFVGDFSFFNSCLGLDMVVRAAFPLGAAADFDFAAPARLDGFACDFPTIFPPFEVVA
ncbi:MAG: hypothetical protein JNL25_10120 [Rhodospirillaceae bacterium]|nr:hypothetical protein [Rhodospirillaceae bacterium]